MSREMKDSGIEWINQIPENWYIQKLKYCLSSPLLYGANESGIEYTDSLPRYIRITDITENGELKDEGKQSLTNEQAAGFLLENYDILFARSGATVGKSFLYKKEYGKAAFAGYLIKASINPKIVMPQFVYYITKSSYYTEWKDFIFSQATIQNISAEKYRQLPIIVPPLSEQKLITKYLDDKCKIIDAAIDKQKKIADNLKDYRQSVITDAVTKGLNPDVEMKEIKVPGIHSIPTKWEVRPLKTLFSFSKGLSITKENLVDTGSKVISYGQIHSKSCDGVHVTEDLIRYVPKELERDNSLVHTNGFIFADTSEDLDGCGNAIFVGENNNIFGGYHTIVLNPNENKNYKYLAYLFRTDAWRTALRQQLTEVKLYSVTQYALKNMYVVLPSDSEMIKISDYLDNKCSSIDAVISKSNSIIDKLEEYKKTLIYEYVTGKKEVPDSYK